MKGTKLNISLIVDTKFNFLIILILSQPNDARQTIDLKDADPSPSERLAQQHKCF